MKRSAFWNLIDSDWRKSGLLWLLLLLNLGAGFLLFLAWTVPISYDKHFRHDAFICERLIRETVIPKLMERNGLNSCDVNSYGHGWKEPIHMKIETPASRDYESITKDLARLHQENFGSGAYIRDGNFLNPFTFLEFDHDAEDLGMTVLIYVSHPGDE